MAIGIIAKLKVQSGKNEEFENAFKDLIAAVKENEPGNHFYVLHRSRENLSSYVVMEQYENQAAVDAHGKSEAFKAASAKLGGCMAGPPEVQIFDGV
jgi:quinol monooxygenase YgiN